MNAILEVFGSLGFRTSGHWAPFPPMPVELVRYTMELAAEEHYDSALSLAVVSKTVRGWVIPILYHTVILSTRERASSFHLSLRSATPQAAAQVKNLFVRSMSDATLHHVVEVLNKCTGVDRLVVDSLYRQPVDPSFVWPKPWEVVFLYGARSWLSKYHPVLQNVSHLHLDGLLFSSTLDICTNLPRLTHLGIAHASENNAVYDDNFARLTRRLLSSTPSLKMVLLHSFTSNGEPMLVLEGRFWGELAKITDERLLARPGLRDNDYHELLKYGITVWDDGKTKFGHWRELVRSA